MIGSVLQEQKHKDIKLIKAGLGARPMGPTQKQVHMSRECPKKSPKFQAKARATDTKEAEGAPPSYPSGGSSSITASTSEDKSSGHTMVQTMNDEEKRRYYILDHDFYNTDLYELARRRVQCTGPTIGL
jgi:hypothetical protein